MMTAGGAEPRPRALEVARRRLASLRLEGPRLGSIEEVVRWLGAVQSQDYAGGKWSIGQRAIGIRNVDHDQAYADGRLLRTHVLRPTWHFVLPADIRWLQRLTAPRVHALNGHYCRQFGLDDDSLRHGEAYLRKALSDGSQLTRTELQPGLANVGIRVTGPALAYVLMNAELNGTICSGGLRGKQHTYALLDARAPAVAEISRDESLAELTLRFFSSHGPATMRDFSWWSSLTTADIKRGLDMLGPRVASEEIEGTTYWFAAEAEHSSASEYNVQLLQGFDEYFVGYAGKSKEVLDVSQKARAHVDSNPRIGTHVVLVDGQVIGHWRRTIGRTEVVVETDLFTALDEATQEALRRAIDEYAAFLDVRDATQGKIPSVAHTF